MTETPPGIPTINQQDLSKEKMTKVIKDMSEINKVEKLRNWYFQYIDHFRNEYEKLSVEEKQCVSNSKNFLKPCQIEVFWIKEPSFQLIIQSNFKDRPDKEIIINGPFNTQEFFEKTRPVLNEPRWERKIERDTTFPDSHDTYAETLARHIHFFIENFKRFLFGHLSGSRYSMGQALENLWAQHYIGNIAESDYQVDVDQIIMEVKEEAKRRENRKNEIIPSSPPHEQKWDGYGVHLFPPLIIGKKTKLTIEQLLHGNTYDISYTEKIFDTKLAGHLVIVNRDGYIFIETTQKTEALRILNLIMAVGIFHELPLFAVREHELSNASYDKQNLYINSTQWSYESRRSFLFEEQFGRNVIRTYQKREVAEEKIKEIIQDAEIIFKYEKISEDLRLFNESSTHLLNSEYSQSFIMSWTVLERHYSDLWRQELDQKDVEGERLSKLTNSALWSTDYIFEVLNLNGEIDDSSYDLLMELKRKRNRFYHSGKHITKEDAERSLSFATKILLDKISSIKNKQSSS